MICEHCGEDIGAGYGVYRLPGETQICEECLYTWARSFYQILPEGKEERYVGTR